MRKDIRLREGRLTWWEIWLLGFVCDVLLFVPYPYYFFVILGQVMLGILAYLIVKKADDRYLYNRK